MPEIHPEHRNIALNIESDLDTIGKEAKEKYEGDEDSRSEWMEMHAQWIRLYYQQDKPINPPWEGSSQESLPMLAEACNQFHARAFQALFPSHNKFIRCIPTGEVEEKSAARAERVQKHMSWQLLVRDRTYKKNKDRLLLSLPLHGSAFTKCYYDPIRQRNIVDNVRAVDLVVPYGTGPRDIEDIERKSQIIWMTRNRAKYFKDSGYFSDTPEPWTTDERTEADRAHDEAQGLEENAYDRELSKVIEQHALLDLDDDGLPEPYIVTFDAESGKILRVSIRYETDDDGQPLNQKVPIEFYNHYTYMENPDGFYGLGMGHLVSQLNASGNKLLRQYIDAGTLANVGNMTGFASQQLGGVEGREIELSLGKFIKVPGAVDDIARSIFQLKFPAPQPALMEGVTLLMNRADRLATTTEAITGQTDKVMQPTTIISLIEQSMQLFSAVYERVIEANGVELQKYYDLNYKYMDEEEYFGVLDVTGKWIQEEVAKEDYRPDLQIMPIADPRQATKQQKLAQAELEYTMAMQNPLIMQSIPHMYNVTRRFFEKIGVEAIDEVLPNPAQMQQARVDDPHVENMGALAPQPVIPPAFPGQDHELHILSHGALLTEHGDKVSELGRALMEAHIQQHVMLAYGEGSGTGAMEGMVPGPGNGGGIPEAERGLSGLPVETGADLGALPEGEGTAGRAGLL